MITKYIIAITIIFVALFGWIIVQTVARLFATRHPEFGPVREEGGGCGLACNCSHGSCCEKSED